VVGIVEQKDATPEQQVISEVNTGVLVAPARQLKQWLSGLTNKNAQGEYYLTDIIAAAHNAGSMIQTAQPSCAQEVEGANNRLQLAQLERFY
ncbi:MAG: bifunctional UDP-N-acetylglucosamine diphosphorylase/glucosamine-1-phosphate N-acetyltransferase GlmU, partial [Tolumonas sp.]